MYDQGYAQPADILEAVRIDRKTYCILAVTTFFCSCVKPFSPAVTTVNQNILVVEGFIDTGGDTTKIKLSHTVTIGNKISSVIESGATVTVENATGTSYPVPETKVKGSYASAGALAITSGKQYRIRIKTSGSKTYASDLVDAKATPPIDSIGHTYTSDGIQFYVNAHDATNNTRYYKYAFSEAWEFHAKYGSGWISNGVNGATPRTTAQDIFFCYNTDSSTFVTLNSTAALASDVVSQFPINSISQTSEKLEIRYTILISQQALTKDGYNFWHNIKTNTEQLGSIFDAQPSAISGNIHNVNVASEPVIGFISAGSIQKKRIYINKTDLPASFLAQYPYLCDVIDGAVFPTEGGSPPAPIPWAWAVVIRQPSPNRITDADGPGGPYSFTTAECADCTIRGTHNPPSFWKF